MVANHTNDVFKSACFLEDFEIGGDELAPEY